MRKFEIARMLARRYGYRSYLEIVTATTGGTYSEVDKEQFSRRTRLMYRCPVGFSDGEPIDWRTEAESSEGPVLELTQSGERFDLVFVDPFHTYASSLRDIVFALHLTKQDGLVLIHDCNPPEAGIAAPEFQSGEWCGVTYAAYLDVALFAEALSYVTVDTDYGCGIISKRPRPELFGTSADAALAAGWKKLPLAEKYLFFEENRAQLLQLISPEELQIRLK